MKEVGICIFILYSTNSFICQQLFIVIELYSRHEGSQQKSTFNAGAEKKIL